MNFVTVFAITRRENDTNVLVYYYYFFFLSFWGFLILRDDIEIKSIIIINKTISTEYIGKGAGLVLYTIEGGGVEKVEEEEVIARIIK